MRTILLRTSPFTSQKGSPMIRILPALTLMLFVSAAAYSADAPTPTPNATPAVAPVPALPAPAKPFVYKPADMDIVTGKDSAPVVLVEYASLSCPHCAHFFTTVLPELTTKYIDTGKVKLVYRHYPLNDPALKAAELVQCAEPDRRHTFVKVLFTTQMKWAYDASYRDSLSNIAALGGMDRLKFESCMNDKSIEKSVLSVAKEASDDYKINSTPSFFINNKPYKDNHDVASMSKAIDAALAAAKTK